MSIPSHRSFHPLLSICASLALTGAASAAVLDLGTSGSGTLGGAVFSTTDIQPTGTGVFDPFLTVQNTPWEQGYNGTNGNFDTKRVPQWNHEITLGDLRATAINGTNYYGFVVDVNEPNGGNQAGISLDALRLFVSPTIQTNTSVDASGFFNGSLGTKVFDLGNNQLKYTDAQHGSGSGDINIFIPVADFAGFKSSDYVYMYQRWGNTDASQGGFEETAIRQGFVPVPEMGTLFPVIGLMTAVLSTQVLRRRKMKEIAAMQLSSK
jgi:hypothetical protein